MKYNAGCLSKNCPICLWIHQGCVKCLTEQCVSLNLCHSKPKNPYGSPFSWSCCIIFNNVLVPTPINPRKTLYDDDVADIWKLKPTSASHSIWLFKRDLWVRLSASRRGCLSTHDSANTHNHRHNYSIIHHPLQTSLFFCVIRPILATLVKIFPCLMKCRI